MYPPVYVISLDTPGGRSRLQRMRHHLEDLGIPFTVQKGVHGAHLTPDQVSSMASGVCGRVCTPSTIGCGASHALVWKRVLESGVPYAIVLEDDTEFVSDAVRHIRYAIPRMPGDADVLVLGCFACGTSARPVQPSSQQIQRIGHFFGTHAYVVTRQGASKLLEYAYPVKYHLDMTMSVLSRSGILNAYSLSSDIAGQGGGEATSQNVSSTVPGFPNILYESARGVRDAKGQSLYFYLSMPIVRVGPYNRHMTLNAVDFGILTLGALGVPLWLFIGLVATDAVVSYRVRGVSKALVLWGIGRLVRYLIG